MKFQSSQPKNSPADDLLLSIVHDMRAYVRSSVTGSQLLERTAGGSLDTAARDHIAAIVGANKSLDRFLGRLTDYAGASHVADGKPISLNSALQTATLQFPDRPVELEPVPANASSSVVPREMVRMFVELIDNGLKFSENQPVHIEVQAPDGGSQLSVTILDKGIGIGPDEESAVFDPLTRLNARDQYPGFGLGLSICRRIADATGATVRLTSNPAGGAMATVLLDADR